MSKVIAYQVRETKPGWYEAWVCRKGFLGFKTWSGLDYQGFEHSWACKELSVREAERSIERHKALQITPFVPKVIRTEEAA